MLPSQLTNMSTKLKTLQHRRSVPALHSIGGYLHKAKKFLNRRRNDSDNETTGKGRRDSSAQATTTTTTALTTNINGISEDKNYDNNNGEPDNQISLNDNNNNNGNNNEINENTNGVCATCSKPTGVHPVQPCTKCNITVCQNCATEVLIDACNIESEWAMPPRFCDCESDYEYDNYYVNDNENASLLANDYNSHHRIVNENIICPIPVSVLSVQSLEEEVQSMIHTEYKAEVFYGDEEMGGGYEEEYDDEFEEAYEDFQSTGDRGFDTTGYQDTTYYCPLRRCGRALPDWLLESSINSSENLNCINPRNSRTVSLYTTTTSFCNPSGYASSTSTKLSTANAIVCCPKCGTAICRECKQLYHPGYLCKDTRNIDPKLAGLLQKEGIKQWPRCLEVVKQIERCHEPKCRCGMEGCWNSSQPIKELAMEGGGN